MRFFKVLTLLVTIFLALRPAKAQDDPAFEAGYKPYGSYEGGNIDTVSLGNGSLNLDIPLISYPQRGGKLKKDFVLRYTNKSSYTDYICEDDGEGGEYCYYQTNGTLSGFSIVDRGSIDVTDDCSPVDIVGGVEFFCNANVTDGKGAGHILAPLTSTSTTTTWESIDASGFHATFTSSPSYQTDTIDSLGTHYYGYGPLVEEDTNGNQVDSPGTSSVWFTDTTGRSIPTGSISYSSGDFAVCPSSSSVEMVSIWNPPGLSSADGGNSAGTYPITLCYYAAPNYDYYGDGTTIVSWMMVMKYAVLPNGETWGFQYSSDNLYNLSQVEFPTGGKISYTWDATGNLFSCDFHTSIYTWAVATRALDPNDGVNPSGTWTYSYGTGSSVGINKVTDPSSNDTVHTFGLGACGLYETETKYYQGSSSSGSNILKTVDTTYSGSASPYAWGGGTFSFYYNVAPTQVTTTWANGQQNAVKYSYDSGFTFHFDCFYGSGFCSSYSTTYTGLYGKQIAKYEYDYGSSSYGSLLRSTLTNYLAFSSSSYLTNNLLDLPSSVQVKDGGGTQRAYTTYTYEGATPTSSGVSTQHDSSPPAGSYRGNLTSVARWLNTTSGYLTDTNAIYDTGMLHVSTDPNGNSTTDSYDSTGTYATQITYPATGSVSHVENFTYDFNTGLRLTHSDQNSQTDTYTYDPMMRLTGMSYPDGGSDSYSYPDANDFIFTKVITSSQNFVEQGTVDGFGRATKSKTTVNSSASTCSGGYVYTVTSYDSSGHKASVSNPDCSSSPSAVTSYQYDALSRATKVIPPDGSTSSDYVGTSYSGACTTVTDQASKARKSCTDGLGRMTGVWEDPSGSNYETDYTYDTLDNLASVSQNSSRSRSFTYDSQSRLTAASNPESGTVNYTYDADGNMATKTDARSITTTYAYDALNRLTQKSYSDSTPTVKYVYDGSSVPSGCSVGSFSYGSYPKPHQTAMCDSPGSEAWSYDNMGRALADQRITNSITETTVHTYNDDGSIATLVYPSGRTITYAPNNGMPPLSAEDTANSINYATNAVYAPQGALASLANGSSLVSTFFYDSRLQPCRISVKSSGTAPSSCTSSTAGNVFDFTYNFNLGSSDNGNVIGITNNIDATRSLAFTYDSLNRIATAETASTYSTSPAHCWGESYTIDAWGNLTGITPVTGSYSGCTVESLSLSVGTNNRISTSGFGYDSSGNMTSGPSSGTTYTYNAESQMTQAAASTTTGYVYDGDGKRVEKTSGSTVTKIYWYDTGGDVLDETDGSGTLTDEYIFFGGKRIARRDSSSNIDYYFADDLGSARVVTNASGTVQDDSDFYPYGGERVITSSSGNPYKFTGKERDTESNLDDFGARYYSSQYGRFMTADWSAIPAPVPYANLTNPQTLNLYAIVADNPETFADLDGHCSVGDTIGICTGANDVQVGEPGQVSDPTPAPPPQVLAAQNSGWSLSWQVNASANFLVGEVTGVADATVTPVVNAVEHPIQTVEGIANAVEHPVDTAKAIANGAVDTVKAAANGDPRAFGQVVGTVAAVAYAAENVRPQSYPNAGGGGVNILNTPTTGSRIGLDVHGIPEAGGAVRPHIDITIKKPGIPSGPGSNLVNIKHWPW